MISFLSTVIATFGVFLGVFVAGVLAKEEPASPMPIPTPEVVEVNSYELFWPLVAGRTEDDPLYFLKLFKEGLSGFFIFDLNKKADYAVLLGTKRVLEAEQLLNNGKSDTALKALERSASQFSSAYNSIEKADSDRKLLAGKIRRDRLINVKILVDYLKTASDEKVRPGLDVVREKADVLLRDYLP